MAGLLFGANGEAVKANTLPTAIGRMPDVAMSRVKRQLVERGTNPVVAMWKKLPHLIYLRSAEDLPLANVRLLAYRLIGWDLAIVNCFEYNSHSSSVCLLLEPDVAELEHAIHHSIHFWSNVCEPQFKKLGVRQFGNLQMSWENLRLRFRNC
jgi:hypothetical protein